MKLFRLGPDTLPPGVFCCLICGGSLEGKTRKENADVTVPEQGGL
ncbi:hypothetical protein C8J38_1011236 [Rhizobium sp. PP-WC-2G-219]|nr:hypothetical protein C8J38_1011236 [Rhizobium sp. PP-WC-2G-219]